MLQKSCGSAGKFTNEDFFELNHILFIDNFNKKNIMLKKCSRGNLFNEKINFEL